jgi:sensory rhodopsin
VPFSAVQAGLFYAFFGLFYVKDTFSDMEPTTIVYAIGTLGMLCGVPPALRLTGQEVGLDFDYLWAIPGIAALMYLLMTFDIGSAEFQGYHVPLPRYIDWALTTPLLVGYTAYVAGVEQAKAAWIAVADFLMIMFGVFAAAFPPPEQWVFFTLSALCHLALLIGLYVPVRNSAYRMSSSRRRLGRLLLNYIGLLWLAYPVVWVFGPGLQVVSPEGLAVIITYLDVTAKVPFVYFIYRARNNFLRSGKSESGPAPEDTSPSVPAT